MGPVSSPTKRNGAEDTLLLNSSSSTTSAFDTNHAQIWKWTLTNDAVAPCFIRDVLSMVDGGGRDPDFFWLGRIPCRNVRLVGLIVGISVYEKRTVYMLDDGTAVVECIHKPNTLLNKEPPKSHHPANVPRSTTLKAHTGSPSKGRGSPSKSHQPFSKRRQNLGASAQSVPQENWSSSCVAQFRVGSCVRVVGRVVRWRDGKQIMINEIELCSSHNEEPIHWRRVRELHRTRYNADAEGGSPFVVPLIDDTSSVESSTPSTNLDPLSKTSGESFMTPTKSRLKDVNQLPSPGSPSSSVSSLVSEYESIHSSPTRSSLHNATSLSTSSSARSQTIIRLRHPARLRSHDLTANTFKIYVKYYMDCAPPLDTLREDSDDDIGSGRCTPTPSRGMKRRCDVDLTPKPTRSHQSLTGPASSRTCTSSANLGFTLSYLRRVPELRYMARRVVKAEAKRRARDERKAAEEQERTQSKSNRLGADKATNSRAHPRNTHPLKGRISQAREPPGAKMKRLFIHAIRKLYDEGSIVIWDGPVRSDTTLARSSLYAKNHCANQSLWKVPSTASDCGDVSTLSNISMLSNTPGVDSSLFSVRDSTSRLDAYRDYLKQADDEEALSDPREDEEAYVPLSPAVLGPEIERVITYLVERAEAKHASLSSRAGSRVPAPPKPAVAPGPTVSEITACLRRRDGRWSRVGDWAVTEALEWLKSEGRIWAVSGRGNERRWEVCL